MDRNAAALVALGLTLASCLLFVYYGSHDSNNPTGLLIGHGFLGENRQFLVFNDHTVPDNHFTVQEICRAAR
jgi:hypothetical protein